MKGNRAASIVLSILLGLTILAPYSLTGTNLAHADNYSTMLELDFNSYSLNAATVSAARGGAFTAYPGSLNIAAGEYYDASAISPRTDKSLVIHTKMTNNASLFRSGYNITGKVIVEANVRLSDTVRNRDVFEVKNATKTANNVYGGAFATFFRFSSNGTVVVNNNTDLGITYQADTWYHVQAVVDNNKGTGDFYLDGVRVLHNDRLPSSNDNGSNVISQFKFQQGLNSTNSALQTFGNFILDDVIVTQVNSLGDAIDTGQEVKGWRAFSYTGAPVFAEDTSETVNMKTSLRISAASGSTGAYSQEYAIIPGESYTYSSFWRGKGLVASTSYIKAVLTAMKDGEKLQVDNLDVEEETPATKTDSNGFGERIVYHYTAPADADHVRVQLVFAGPGTAWFNDPRFEQKQKWQDVLGRYSSADVQHPVMNPANMFGYGAWTGIANETQATLVQKVAPIMAMTDTELRAAAKVDAYTRDRLDIRGSYEAMSRRLADLYAASGDEAYARKAIIILIEEARWYPDVPLTGGANFFFKQTAIPIDSVYAYDLLYSSPEWVNVQALYADEDIRAVVEGWFRTSAMNMYNYYSPGIGSYDNIAPYGIRAVMGTAAILNDPDMIRLYLPWIDSLLTNQELYADGFWREATVSYHNQVINLLVGAFQLLQQNYVDPANYVDAQYNLHFDSSFHLSSRYPLLEKALLISNQMRLPDGSPVSLNDTWNQDPALKSVNDPILPDALNNIELYNYGHFSLVQGDTADATYAGLTFPQNGDGGPYTTGGHQHGDYLNLNLFGSGMEVIPDTGYPHDAVANRFVQMTAPMHNIPWAWSSSVNDYTAASNVSTRASMLAYDPGDKSGKAIQLVEASEPGPLTDQVDTKRRMLMLVNMEGNRSYTFDLSRLKGGDAHQLFMRAVEEEDTELTSSLNVIQQPDADVKSYMSRIGHSEGLPAARDFMKLPLTAAGDDDFQFTWTGEQSGTSMRAHMNGIAGGEVIFSRISTLRRTYNQAELKDSFPGWHFQRRQLVSPNDTTRYGAVYETWRAGQQPLINSVAWESTDDQDPMTQVAVIDTEDYVDIIYVSDDTVVREYEGIQFAGRTAMVRMLKADETYVQGYIYGEGSITAPGFTLQGKPDIQVEITGTTSTYNGAVGDGTVAVPAMDNALLVSGSLPTDGSLAGSWVQTFLGDGSGFGLKIKGIDNNRITTQDYPPFTVVPGGARGTYYPFTDKFIAGNVTARISQPTFVSFR